MKTVSYSSKIDLWLLISFCLVSAFILFEVWLYCLQEGSFSIAIIAYLLFVLTMIWLPVFNTKYVLSDDLLIVKCLFFKWEIKLKNIRSIKTIRSIRSAPALSTQRLEIQYVENGVEKNLFISPSNLTNFLTDFQSKHSSY